MSVEFLLMPRIAEFLATLYVALLLAVMVAVVYQGFITIVVRVAQPLFGII